MRLLSVIGVLVVLPAAEHLMPGLLASLDSRDQYRVALPGYRYQFPRDNFNHSDFQTEWWYYTGNVKASDGHRFGFELTFFRQGVSREKNVAAAPRTLRSAQPELSPGSQAEWQSDPGAGSSAFDWPFKDIYLAHFALTDLDGAHYFHSERLNRAGPGLAGAKEEQSRIWNGNWEVRWNGKVQVLQALTEQWSVRLLLNSLKPPVINGVNGVSQKASGAGKASYYISFTRLAANGTISVSAKSYQVSGLAWMDHEFFTNQLDRSEAGWDWMGLQLDDGSELMLYRLRHRDGSTDPNSAGTYVDAQAQPQHLTAADFHVSPGAPNWTSPATKATYPVRWRVEVPSLELHLNIGTPFEAQEFTSQAGFAPSYWEGAVEVQGAKSSRPLSGVGYLEMTGYERPLSIGE